MTYLTSITQVAPAAREQHLRVLAEKLESQFLAEMLKSAGVGKARDAFGGGAGEDHFSGFLASEYANATVRAGGIGLSEAIFKALTREETQV